jgi:hypothetical protein
MQKPQVNSVSALAQVREMIRVGIVHREIAPEKQFVLVPMGIFERLWDEVNRGMPVPADRLHKRMVIVNGAQIYPVDDSVTPMVLTEAEAGRWLSENE